MKNFKIGIIGCGAIYSLHIESIKNNDNLEISAICDTDFKKAETEAEKYGCPAFSDYKEMIEKCTLDAVHILTPHYLHPEMSVYALEKGVNVLCEKPMAITYADAEKMVNTSEKSEKSLGIIFQNRYNASSIAVKNELNGKALGKITGAQFNVFWYRNAEYYNGGEWRGKWDTEGGGVLINQAIHTLDLTNWLIGEEPMSVNASIANRSLRGIIETEDEASGLIKYKNGISASFFVCNHSFPGRDIEIEIFCENGKAKIRGNRAFISFKNGDVKSISPDIFDNNMPGKAYWGNSHNIQINQFYDSLSKGEIPEIDGKEALKTQKILCAIYDSAKQNREITF